MIHGMLLQIGALLWVGAAMALAVHVVSPASNPRRHRATFGTMVMVVLLMGAFASVVRGVAYLGVPLWVAGWLAYAVVHLAVYGGWLGLGPWRSLLMAPAKWLAFFVFDTVARWLWGAGAA